MTPLERRASGGLALIFALRMLGLFLVLPVFALEARHYPGGDDPALVGLALGGVLLKSAGMPGLFAATASLVGLWLLLAWPLQPPGRPPVAAPAS